MRKKLRFQSTHPSWGATRAGRNVCFLLEISIHAPIVGCDHRVCMHKCQTAIFQSTHPSWGATMPPYLAVYMWKNFNPRTHRGVRLLSSTYLLASFLISIHAPIVGCDPFGRSLISDSLIFQSTHPSWGATKPPWQRTRSKEISIHAPIVGCDKDYEGIAELCYRHFNPRTHRGVRHSVCVSVACLTEISIHAPIVGCDQAVEGYFDKEALISIHAPIVGCDLKQTTKTRT